MLRILSIAGLIVKLPISDAVLTRFALTAFNVPWVVDVKICKRSVASVVVSLAVLNASSNLPVPAANSGNKALRIFI